MEEDLAFEESLKALTQSMNDLTESPPKGSSSTCSPHFLATGDFRQKYEDSRNQTSKEKEELKESLKALSRSMSDLLDSSEEKKVSPILKKSLDNFDQMFTSMGKCEKKKVSFEDDLDKLEDQQNGNAIPQIFVTYAELPRKHNPHRDEIYRSLSHEAIAEISKTEDHIQSWKQESENPALPERNPSWKRASPQSAPAGNSPFYANLAQVSSAVDNTQQPEDVSDLYAKPYPKKAVQPEAKLAQISSTAEKTQPEVSDVNAKPYPKKIDQPEAELEKPSRTAANQSSDDEVADAYAVPYKMASLETSSKAPGDGNGMLIPEKRRIKKRASLRIQLKPATKSMDSLDSIDELQPVVPPRKYIKMKRLGSKDNAKNNNNEEQNAENCSGTPEIFPASSHKKDGENLAEGISMEDLLQHHYAGSSKMAAPARHYGQDSFGSGQWSADENPYDDPHEMLDVNPYESVNFGEVFPDLSDEDDLKDQMDLSFGKRV